MRKYKFKNNDFMKIKILYHAVEEQAINSNWEDLNEMSYNSMENYKHQKNYFDNYRAEIKKRLELGKKMNESLNEMR